MLRQEARRWAGVRRWVPPLLWFLVVSGLSTDAFSVEETGALLLPLLAWLFPAMSAAGVEALHFALRKAGHVSEFAVLTLLWYRALAWGRAGWQWRVAAISALVAAGLAAVDEMHQVFTASRTPSIIDVGWDTLGTLLALGGLWLFFWIRNRRRMARDRGGARGAP